MRESAGDTRVGGGAGGTRARSAARWQPHAVAHGGDAVLVDLEDGQAREAVAYVRHLFKVVAGEADLLERLAVGQRAEAYQVVVVHVEDLDVRPLFKVCILGHHHLVCCKVDLLQVGEERHIGGQFLDDIVECVEGLQLRHATQNADGDLFEFVRVHLKRLESRALGQLQRHRGQGVAVGIDARQRRLQLIERKRAQALLAQIQGHLRCARGG